LICAGREYVAAGTLFQLSHHFDIIMTSNEESPDAFATPREAEESSTSSHSCFLDYHNDVFFELAKKDCNSVLKK
jgi:hypothetical protein